MPGTPNSGELQQRYDVIEKAYCEGRWSLVIEAGTILLRDLSDVEDKPRGTALFHRTQLLIAHTLLHGYGDREAAEDVYEAVRQSGAESSLRQIAEEGLDQCNQPLPSTLGDEEPEGEEEEEAAMATRPNLFLPDDERSNVEESEAPLGRAKAGAGLSYTPRQQRSTAVSQPAPARGTATAPAAAEGSTPAETAQRGEATGQGERGPIDLGLAADPFRPISGQASRPGASPETPVMPWLAETAAGSAAPNAMAPAGQGVAANRAQPETLALVPDVVEEPELMEVHQSSPSLAEEVDLVVKANASDAASPRGALAEDPDHDLRSCLLLVRVD